MVWMHPGQKESDVVVLLPCKRFDVAKSRLTPILDEYERVGLIECMLLDVLEAVYASTRVSEIVLVSNDRRAHEIGNRFDARCLPDTSVGGLRESVTIATKILADSGQASIFILPSDIPAVTTDDIDSLISLASPDGVVLVPDRHCDGTNALLFPSTSNMEFHYGPHSFRHHLVMARRKGLSVSCANLASISLDIDTPEDLKFFTTRSSSSHAWRYLEQLNTNPGRSMPTRQELLHDETNQSY